MSGTYTCWSLYVFSSNPLCFYMYVLDAPYIRNTRVIAPQECSAIIFVLALLVVLTSFNMTYIFNCERSRDNSDLRRTVVQIFIQ